MFVTAAIQYQGGLPHSESLYASSPSDDCAGFSAGLATGGLALFSAVVSCAPASIATRSCEADNESSVSAGTEDWEIACPSSPTVETSAADSCAAPAEACSSTEEALRFLPDKSRSLCFSRRRLRSAAETAHWWSSSSPSAATAEPAETATAVAVASVPADLPSRRALSASSRCRRNSSSCSAVSFLTAASCARVDSSSESRKSTSSSSRARNWFFNLIFSSNASCLATAHI